MAGLEVDTAAAFLYSTLRADPRLAGIGVHDTIATPTSTDPTGDQFLVFQHQGGTRLRGIGTATVWADLVMAVKVVQRSYLDSRPLRAAIHDCLQGARATLTDGTVISCVAEQPFVSMDRDGDQVWTHIGDTWRLYVT